MILRLTEAEGSRRGKERKARRGNRGWGGDFGSGAE